VRKPLHEPGTELSVVTRAMAASAKQTFELVSQLHQAVMLASTNFTTQSQYAVLAQIIIRVQWARIGILFGHDTTIFPSSSESDC
jgi:hypothetical protein